MALPGLFGAWLSLHVILCACHDQNRHTAPAGFPALDDLEGLDPPLSAAAAPARTRTAEFPGFPTLDDLVGPEQVLPALQGDPRYPNLGRTWAKNPDFPIKRAEEHAPEDYAPDLTELIIITGHVDRGDGRGLRNMTLNYLKEELGWEQGLWVTFMENPRDCHFDKALTWRKGRECYATWSATDDARDIEFLGMNLSVSDAGLPRTIAMCGFDINTVVAYQMQGFMRSPDWPRFVDYFADERCETVTSVGHSLGGAMATLFAACANRRVEGFGGRHDFGLVTFGNFPISPEPLYSGTPGTPFVGTRYHVAANPGRKSSPRHPRAFRLDILELYRRIAGMMKVSSEYIIGEHAKAIAELRDDEVEEYWVDNELPRLLTPFHHNVGMLRLLEPGHEDYDPATYADVRAYFTELKRRMVLNGDTFIDHDTVSSFMKVYGYKHALVDFQPVSNKQRGVVRMERVPAELATGLPDDDHWQNQLSTVSGRLQNHYICCYYRGPFCLYLFKYSSFKFKACETALFR